MVALNVWPTDGADGSVATEARWRKMGRHWAPTGVVPVGGLLKPTLAGTTLTVQDGAAWVDGHFAELLGSQVLTVTANGIVVVRFDPAANTAQLVYRDGVSTPAQDPNGVYEMPIAQIVGGVLADRRPVGPTGIQVGQAGWTLVPTGVWTRPIWGTAMKMRDVGGSWLPANSTNVTVPQAGLYSIDVTVGFASGPVGQQRVTVLLINDNPPANASFTASATALPLSANDTWMQIHHQQQLAAGDRIGIRLYQDGGASLSATTCYLTTLRLADA